MKYRVLSSVLCWLKRRWYIICNIAYRLIDRSFPFSWLGACILLLLSLQGNTQNLYNDIRVTNVINPTVAVQEILGNNSGVEVLSVGFSGSAEQLGTFYGSNNYIGFDKGVILSTGGARLAESSNVGLSGCVYTDVTLHDGTTQHISQSFRSEWPVMGNNTYSDPDLNAMGLGNPVGSAVLEFDFIPHATGITFRFVFASDEYPEYVDLGFFDVFGFFISGPNISGPYSNGGINIALVPGTNDPVSVATVNDQANSAFFIQNYCFGTNCGTNNNCCPCPQPKFQYDGFTRVLTARLDDLECDSVYHIRLAISNINDPFVGSAVFIEAGSFDNTFEAGPATAAPSPVCEGNAVTLHADGNPGYVYAWTDAQQQPLGNTQTLVIPAVSGQPPYMVTITDPSSGCFGTFQANPVVHILDNEAPYTMGINNTGDFEYYVPAGVIFSFDIFSFDDENENIQVQVTGLPVGVTSNTFINITPSGTQHPYLIISGHLSVPGEYIFQLFIEDDNTCGVRHNTYEFKIIVLCPDCLGNIYYERRGLSATLGDYYLLPMVTEASGSITAGESVDPQQPDGAVVILPGLTAEFYATTSVRLEPGFIVHPTGLFKAGIIPAACDDDCTDCCQEGNAGFTIHRGSVPNIFTPNNDGINDFWFIPDYNHSNCAFGIMGFHLSIFNRNGNLIHDIESHSEGLCCVYKAPGPLNPMLDYSSIWWDGRVNWPTMGGPYVVGGTYDYVLTLYGCDGYEETWQGFITVSGV